MNEEQNIQEPQNPAFLQGAFSRSAFTLYHCTTEKKMQRYQATGGILSPVRGWIFENSAKEWCKKTGRNIILKIEVEQAYPLPDHKPTGHGYWSPDFVRKWDVVALKEPKTPLKMS